MTYLFDVPAFFIIFRETLEVVIILSVLLGFIDKMIPNDQTLNKAMKRQVWIGSIAGVGLSVIIAVIFIVIFYKVANNLWEKSESAWEGAFSLIACAVITLMAFSMVRVTRWKKKWENKLEHATEQYLEKHEKGNKRALVFLPFTVVMREALESIVFIAGIGYDKPASGLPIAVITGLIAGCAVGFAIYRGSHTVSLEVFFGIMTTFLFFIAAGLFSYAINALQLATHTKRHYLWKLSCCNPGDNKGWAIAQALFGWRPKATVGTTAGYFAYWAAVLCGLVYMHYRTKREDRRSDDPEMQSISDEKDAATSAKGGHTISWENTNEIDAATLPKDGHTISSENTNEMNINEIDAATLPKDGHTIS